MKKIILFLFLLAIPFFTSANSENITFNLSNSLRLDENEGEVYLPTVKIDLKETTTKNLNLSISKSDFLIFANTISNIEVNNLKTNINKVVLDEKNKILKIELNEEISGKIEIKGIKIRTYDQRIRSAKIGLDYNNDNIIDLYSTNVIDLDENGRYSDTMKPLPVSDVKYELTKDEAGKYNITVTWKNSPDLDLYGSFVKVNKNNDYGNIKEQFIGKLDKSSFTYTNMDLEKDSYRIEIYSKDFYYLNTNPYIINLDKKDLIIDTVEEEKESVDTIEKEETIEKTENIEKDIEPVVEETQVTILEKHIPKFTEKNKKILSRIVRVIDKFIKIKKIKNLNIGAENTLMIIRNDIVYNLEKFDKADKNDKADIIKILIELINNLKSNLL